MSKWDQIGLKAIQVKLDTAFDEKKYTVFQDLQGMAGRFMNYSGICCDLEGDLRKLKLNLVDEAHVREKMRAAFVNGMRTGDKVCYMFGEEAPDLQRFSHPEEFPINTMFDFKKGRDHDTYFKITKEDERWDMVSRVVDGHFYMQDDFKFTLVTQCKDEEQMKKFLSSFPSEQFSCFQIQPWVI